MIFFIFSYSHLIIEIKNEIERNASLILNSTNYRNGKNIYFSNREHIF